MAPGHEARWAKVLRWGMEFMLTVRISCKMLTAQCPAALALTSIFPLQRTRWKPASTKPCIVQAVASAAPV